jgi:hypothetical protein
VVTCEARGNGRLDSQAQICVRGRSGSLNPRSAIGLTLHYGSPTFTVKKKDGTYQIVHDYRKLNEYTIMDVTPLPSIKSILEDLRGKTLFSKFNICTSYNNIHIRPEDTHKMGFKMSCGLYEWIVMPFGLCNALATFTRLGNDVLQPMYTKFPGKF